MVSNIENGQSGDEFASDSLSIDREMSRIIVRRILGEAGFRGDVWGAIMRRINSPDQIYHFLHGEDVKLIEVGRRKTAEGEVHTARLYFDVCEEENGNRYVPVVCIAPEDVLGKLATHEPLRISKYQNGIIRECGDESLFIEDNSLRKLPDMERVLNQPYLAFAPRKASFRLTSLERREIGGRPVVFKRYPNLAYPERQEFLGHLVGWDESQPLVSITQIGDIPGICVTNSVDYMTNHPELQFI